MKKSEEFADGMFRPKGGWCSRCIRMWLGSECGGEGAMMAVRLRRGSVVHIAAPGAYATRCGQELEPQGVGFAMQQRLALAKVEKALAEAAAVGIRFD